MAKAGSTEKVVQEIRRQTRRRFSAEEKIRIVLEGLRGEEGIGALPRRCCMKTLRGWDGLACTSRAPPQQPHYRDEVEASPAPWLARVSSAASPVARHPTSGTTRETHRASLRTPPATGPARSGSHAACGAPRRHTMPSAPAVVKRGGVAGRTSVSQSVGTTGHSVRLNLRPQCPGSGHNQRIL